MEKKSIKELKDMINTKNISEQELNFFKKDNRKGVQNLLRVYENKLKQKSLLKKEFLIMSKYENKHYQLGKSFIAGIDEAGRGPLAGPVVAAAVILPKNFKLLGLTDSKLLTESKREEFYEIITREATSYGISIIDNNRIDKINILEATKEAMLDSLKDLNVIPDHVLIDAVKLDAPGYSTESLIKGDLKSVSIAAASILAKVTRDRIMLDIHHQYPNYLFHKNKGYGTKQHLDMLEKHGATSHHRKTFSPVRNIRIK